MLDPITNPLAWDKFVLAGVPSPGLCVSVAGATNPRVWDEKKGAGTSGAGLVYQGDGLAKFVVRLMLWTPDHFSEWQDWKKVLVPPTEKNPSALDAFHPQLVLLPVPITSVVVEEAGSPEPSGEDTWVVEIKFKQYRKPVPAQAKPKGSKSNTSSGGETEKPSDPVDQYIDALAGQVNDLANRSGK